MNLPLFYIEQIDDSALLILPEESSKHIVQVLRMNRSDLLQLTDGKGHLLTAEIIDDHKKRCAVKVIERKWYPQNAKAVAIAIGLLKNTSRFEWFLEKATELGVKEIFPLITGRTEKQHFRFERMKHIVVSGMLQSQQVWLPILHEPNAYDNVITNCKYETKLIAHCEPSDKTHLKSYAQCNSTLVLIGPEGDFTAAEIHAATANHFKPVTLGDNRLRTETAAIVAATLLLI